MMMTTTMMTTRLRLFFYFFFVVVLMLLNPVTCSDDNNDETENDGVYDYTFMEDVCHENSDLRPGVDGRKKFGFVMPDSDGCYDALVNCQLQLNTTTDHQITIRFQELSTYCPEDTVYIRGETDEDTKNYCGFYAPSYSLYSTSNLMRIQFVTGTSVSFQSSCLTGFKLYYTAYHTGECSENEFRCSYEGRCIPMELICDTYDNCGDWSDESAATCGLSTGSVIAISVIGALIGLSFLVFVVYFIYDRTSGRKTRRHRRQNNTTTTTTRERGGGGGGGGVPPDANYEGGEIPPPLYTYVNTITAGFYDEQDFDPNSPPSYNAAINSSSSRAQDA